MKKLLLFLSLVPTLAFTQVSSWRSGSSSGISRGSSTLNNPSISRSQSNVSNWRSSSSSIGRGNNRRPVVINDPWFGWNRWNMWGAPAFGWNFWQPMWYWNDWGYRQPARIYVYENGQRDTIRGKKPIMNFVISRTSNNQIGASFSIGNKHYFIVDYVSTYQPDVSTFFPFGTIDRVDFPLISDLIKERTIYLGGGVRFKRTGVHMMLGFGNQNVRWRGKDDFGEITFPKYNTNFMTAKIGVMHDVKNLTFKIDADPIRQFTQFGVGLNF